MSELARDFFFARPFKMTGSAFIRPMHPKTEIRADRAAMEKVLNAGWVGQLKIHGHRAQIHISSNLEIEPLAYNRQGQLHKLDLSKDIIKELRRLFLPSQGWNVIDAEWLKPEGKLFVFDYIKKDGELLNNLNYGDRFKLLPRAYISPSISTLPVITDITKCLDILKAPPANCEGLVFKSTSTRGFEDTSIVRCRFSKNS
jgi:hypothetical protein